MTRRVKRLRIEIESVINGGLFSGIKPAISFMTREFVPIDLTNQVSAIPPHDRVNLTMRNAPLPEDIKFVSMNVDPMRPGYLYVYLESEEWPEVDYKKEISDVPIVIVSHYPVDLGEPVSKPLQQTTSKQSTDIIEHEEVPENSLPVKTKRLYSRVQPELGSLEHH